MREPGNSTTLSKLERQALEVGILDADCGCRVTNDDGRLVDLEPIASLAGPS